MKRRRNFNRSERIALWMSADGVCENCGAPLDRTWESDHIEPFSKGGETDLANAAALCRKCNREKGNSIMPPRIELREFQSRFVDGVLLKATQNEKVFVADVHPGSGKTLASQAAADKLMQLGIIQQVIVVVPRINLAVQYELDWEEFCNKLSWKPTMQSLRHSDNTPPLIYAGASGYITTYSSLVSKPMLHIRQIKQKPTLVIFDEADRLGADTIYDDFTESAKWAEELGKHAKMIIVMSGTPFRADNKPLLFATYSEPDRSGNRKLISDVSSTYRDGVREGYLRRFQFTLHDGGYKWVDMDGERDISLQDDELAVSRALDLSGFYEPLVDKFVEKLQEHKRLMSNKMCGLVAARSQNHAKEIMQYLNRRHPHLRCLIAVSDDGTEAQKALRAFKENNHDVLVTVSMAYVGYDHKPISTMLLLTSFRTEAYLRQLVARGLRMSPDVEIDRQHCHVIAPDDPRMARFVNKLRDESEWGFKERLERHEPPGGNGGNGNPIPLGFAKDGFVDKLRAMGIDPEGDMTHEEYEYAERLRQSLGLPTPVSDLVAFAKGFNSPTSHQPVAVRPTRTLAERIKDAKSILKTQCAHLAFELRCEVEDVYAQLKRVYGGKGTGDIRSVEEVRSRSKTILRWNSQGFMDNDK